MKRNKLTKIFALLLCGLMTCSLFSCNFEDIEETSPETDEITTEAQTEKPTEETGKTLDETTSEEESSSTDESIEETTTVTETTDEEASTEETSVEETTIEETTAEETTSEEKTTEEETTYEEVTGDYSNATGIGAAGAFLDDDAFALTENNIDESKAVTKTADEILALLSSKDGMKAGEVYKVTEPLILASDKTYYGNLAVIIAEGGVVINDISGMTLREVIIKGSITVENSSEINLYKLDIKGGNTGITVDDKSSEISVLSSIVSATDIAIDSKGAFVSVYQSKLVAKTGIVSIGTDFTVQSTLINAEKTGITSSGRYFIARNNTITVNDTKNGIGIEMAKGSYNSMAALNVINDVQRSIDVKESYNCVVILNRAITIKASNNTHFYMIKNRMGGELELINNKYIIADGNSFIEDQRYHPTVLEGNTEVNGDTMHDVNARLEFGADEELLPHTDPDQYLQMERREKITDLASTSNFNYGTYVRDAATWNKIVIVPPGAYKISSTVTITNYQSDSYIYSYGAYLEATFSTGMVWNVYGASNVSVNGLTTGHTRSSCGQIHILAVDKANNKLTAVVSAGFVDGFDILASSVPGDVGYNPGFYSMFHQSKDGDRIGIKDIYGGSGQIQSISVNDDGTYTVNMSSVTYIEAGDVFSTRLGHRGQTAVRTDYSDNVKYKDLTVFALANAVVKRSTWSKGVVCERYHAVPHNGYEITKEEYEKYLALEEKYSVDLGVYYDEEREIYRGHYPVLGGSGSLEAENCYDGIKLICSKLEATFDDGSNQRGTSSRIAGMVNNGDGTYTVYYKGNWSSIHQSENSKIPSVTSLELHACAPLEIGDTIVAYSSDGRILINDATVLTNPVAGSPEGLHLAHKGDLYCDECGKLIHSGTWSHEMNTRYDHTTGALSFDTPRSKGYSGSEYLTWNTTIYSVKIDAKYVNEEIIGDYDFCTNDYINTRRVALDNISKNCAGILFDNVLMENIKSRGLLAKTKDVTIKHSTFRNLTMQALVFGPEAEWAESTISRNVLVENCLFDNCAATNEHERNNSIGYNAQPNMTPIDIRGVGVVDESVVSEIQPHEKMLANNFVIRHNKFINAQSDHLICVTGACDVTITENVFEEREDKGEIIYINGCYNINVINNKYSERLQAAFDSGNYAPIADIYNCEYVKIEGLKIPDKVTFKPKN